MTGRSVATLRDNSIRLMTLCLLDGGKEAALLANEISKTLASDVGLSTQSTAIQRWPFLII